MKNPFKVKGTTKYGEKLVYCPVCRRTILTRAIRSHIAARARMEPFKREIGEITKTPHLDFYKRNTIEVEGRKIVRVWKV